MTLSEDEIKAMVRRVLLGTLGPDGVADAPAAKKSEDGPRSSRPAVTEADVLEVPRGGRLSVPVDAVLTPLARDTALERRITLVQEPGPTSFDSTREEARPGSGQRSTSRRTVALAADHGGYSLKEDLKDYLGELGYEVVDCGTYSTASVDYPDFAYAAARLVSEGRAWRGIVVDGAGIGSCMAANKVPGVRAAMCYDHATAVNSREHNGANVLALGGLLVGRSLARQITKTWLETDFGGGRHGRRVDKIMEIEQRFLRR
jgi:ribose 5-phosphate isomerase B